MTTEEIAKRLVELNRAGEYKQAYAELFSEDVVSIENWGAGGPMECRGMDAIRKKGEEWEAGLEEMHEMRASDPLVADSSFAVTFFMDATFKDAPDMPGGRKQMTELAVYRVNPQGKIFREEFC